MDTPVTVVVIESLSYTGTTWLNYVLGSHPEVFCLGPADRPYALPRDQAGTACRVHGEQCAFWPRFYETWDEGENFFVHLAKVSGKHIIMVNNPLPTGAGMALADSRIVVRPIRFVRDGRAVAESFARKHADQAFFDIVRDWLAPSFNNFKFDRGDPDTLCLRYEDVLADQKGMLAQVGGYLDLAYDDSALRFWEHDHHPAAGNAGPVMMIRLYQGEPLPAAGRDKAFYEDQYQKTIANPNHRFESDGWIERLSSRERFIFDLVCGQKNAQLGYERDRFTLHEVRQYSEEYEAAIDIPKETVGAITPAPTVASHTPPHQIASAVPNTLKARQVNEVNRSSGGTVVAVTLAAIVLGVVSILAASGVL